MLPLPIQGSTLALSSTVLTSTASFLGVFELKVWTVLGVETSGCGLLPDRRVQILYERHVFHQLPTLHLWLVSVLWAVFGYFIKRSLAGQAFVF